MAHGSSPGSEDKRKIKKSPFGPKANELSKRKQIRAEITTLISSLGGKQKIDECQQYVSLITDLLSKEALQYYGEQRQWKNCSKWRKIELAKALIESGWTPPDDETLLAIADSAVETKDKSKTPKVAGSAKDQGSSKETVTTNDDENSGEDSKLEPDDNLLSELFQSFPTEVKLQGGTKAGPKQVNIQSTLMGLAGALSQLANATALQISQLKEKTVDEDRRRRRQL